MCVYVNGCLIAFTGEVPESLKVGVMEPVIASPQSGGNVDKFEVPECARRYYRYRGGSEVNGGRKPNHIKFTR